MSSVTIAPISDSDLPRVGEYLHRNLTDHLSASDWARVANPPWAVDAPNHGFMLLRQDEIVGTYLAFYSVRQINGRAERFCNLAAWCVSPGYRMHSLRLLNALLKQPGYHFTDLSPSGNAIAANERLKFARLDTTTALLPNIPWPAPSPRCRFVFRSADIEPLLDGTELQIYRDHRAAAAAIHVVLVDGSDTCYVVFRRDRRKDFPLFASVLYVSNRPLFQRMARFFGGQLLIRFGIPLTLAETRVVGGRPAGSLILRSSRPKMFKSDYLTADDIDYLYSELVCVPW